MLSQATYELLMKNLDQEYVVVMRENVPDLWNFLVRHIMECSNDNLALSALPGFDAAEHA